ncbi:hypothetical protein SAMN02910298_00899 [Pseudobutyrivibrio sp. YE44]|uniref:hypothetical protein n=1 Tax=Pseudobutyrivibrio sp. YE44 TaxID=1520802 RepID=UPI000889CAE1|nr:hypothetical protein [Pseudobutyrivibrio sp. YE44]SDB19587.1 hypothetical protein SAMN02910298_00899 [Pseudobutyrivibrio sp. YE44]
MNINSNVKDEIKDYGRKSAFASFLPGIAGIKGTPIWCYYVNRGQGVVSFGVRDKDNGIMEFYPAHTAYQTVNKTGFRTFIKSGEDFYEPFAKAGEENKMTVLMNGLVLEDKNNELQLKVNVSYTTLPGESIGALLRVVEITNEGSESKSLQVLDGMPALVPYGVGQESLKMMAQTTKAWMQVEDVDINCPYYRVRVSMEDSAEVQKIDGGNFAFGCLGNGEKLPVIVDPNLVFSYDLSLDSPEGFKSTSLKELYGKHQNTSNELPCAFFGASKELEAGETFTLYEMIGQVRNKDILNNFLSKEINSSYFEDKFAEAINLADELTEGVATKTANKTFDDYCRYTYMDNVLRGGLPIKLTDNHTFYVYSRKHGDLERDYNYFSMTPEFYSQGNGNFRDVNQNRRCDTFFSPYVEATNIKMFYSLLQLDGYNPLKIEQMRYQVSEKLVEDLKLSQPFTPGELVAAIVDGDSSCGGDFNESCQRRFEDIMTQAIETVNADFGEGYWSDHWTYNLDLIEDYLEIYPDKKDELLFDTKVKAFDAAVKVKPRCERYVNTKNGVRQYKYLEERANALKEAGYALDKNGKEVEMSLMAKLILLSAIKFATLDPEGLGVEMEGGKPGWYDALNGLPGMLGSSMNETYELARMVKFVITNLKDCKRDLAFPEEIVDFLSYLSEVEKEEYDAVTRWNMRNDLKEEYRARVYENLSGNLETISSEKLVTYLEAFDRTLGAGIHKAIQLGDGIPMAYFSYEVDEFEETEKGIVPKHFSLVKIPYFLEGPVRYLKLNSSLDDKRKIYSKIKDSDLYDANLSMYKVNASLEEASFELGRCRAFTPGWLENESIWLHMEYKYLLELLRSGLYEEFFSDFKDAAIPFLDKDSYGRSTLENSSFIASSKNPNKAIHGKGFVARLSGSTIEFISMWKLMFFGAHLFTSNKDGEICFAPEPAIPEYLLLEADNKYTVEATMLGETKVVYEVDEKQNYIPGDYRITSMTVEFNEGERLSVEAESILGEAAEKIRNRQAKSITIKMTPN